MASSDNLRITWRGLLSLVLLAAPFLIAYRAKHPPTKMTTINKTGKDVYFLLLENGFSLQQARFIMCQAAHETGNFQSLIFKENNNLFGMKLALIRKTTAIGENRGHAVYKTIEDSVKDFKLYYDSFKYLQHYTTIAAYVRQLKINKYFEANETEYKEAMEKFYKIYFQAGA